MRQVDDQCSSLACQPSLYRLTATKRCSRMNGPITCLTCFPPCCHCRSSGNRSTLACLARRKRPVANLANRRHLRKSPDPNSAGKRFLLVVVFVAGRRNGKMVAPLRFKSFYVVAFCFCVFRPDVEEMFIMGRSNLCRFLGGELFFVRSIGRKWAFAVGAV